MSTKKETKINTLLQQIPQGAVVLASWLKTHGYSYDLQQRYLKSNWLESVGRGAFKRTGDKIDLYGALYALQSQAEKEIHIGGRSSLSLQGFAHYVEMQQSEMVLFAGGGINLPVWFLNNKDFSPIRVIKSSFLPFDIGLTTYTVKTFSIKISNPARAMLECLELSPNHFDLEEALLIMEGLSILKPDQVQTLLENCKSIKAKRLFLYLADKVGHSWYKYIESGKINLGSGKRSIVKHGVWIPKYQISIPEIIA